MVGNVLDRGIGKGLYEDMAAHVVALRVLMPDGRGVEVGPFRGAPLPGPGPDLRGLFVQGNLGIVLAMRLRLELMPPVRQLVVGILPGADALAGFLEASGATLQTADPWLRVQISNQARTQAQRGDLGGADAWRVTITTWGKGPDDLTLRTRTATNLLGRFAAEVWTGEAQIEPPEPPGSEGVWSAYAGKPYPMPADPDPDRDRCGVVWVTANLPHAGPIVARFAVLVAPITAAHGFPAAISLRSLDGRALRAVIGLFHDRDEPGSDARAAACSAELHAWIAGNGLQPSRLPITAMAAHPAGERGHVLLAIKAALDPANILAPGRYIPLPSTGGDAPGGALGLPLIGFGRPPPDPNLDRLEAAMSADVAAAGASMPARLAEDVRAVIAGYPGDRAGFLALFYRPAWSFLHWVPLPPDAAGALPILRRLHALCLFLHLWDDHLCDGQLRLTPARLHLRTRAWQAIEADARVLAERVGGGADERCRRSLATYLQAIQDECIPPDLDTYCRRAADQAGLVVIAPALHAALAGADPASLSSIIERFGVAWRIVDDVQDARPDAAAGRTSAVSLSLPAEGRSAWDGFAHDPQGCAAPLLAHVRDALPGLVARANDELAAAARTALSCGWTWLAAELAAYRVEPS